MCGGGGGDESLDRAGRDVSRTIVPPVHRPQNVPRAVFIKPFFGLAAVVFQPTSVVSLAKRLVPHPNYKINIRQSQIFGARPSGYTNRLIHQVRTSRLRYDSPESMDDTRGGGPGRPVIVSLVRLNDVFRFCSPPTGGGENGRFFYRPKKLLYGHRNVGKMSSFYTVASPSTRPRVIRYN